MLRDVGRFEIALDEPYIYTMRYILLLVAILSATTITAQTSGHITYTTVTQMDPERLQRIPEHIRSQIPKEFTRSHELYFTVEHSLYRAIPEDPQAVSTRGGVTFRGYRRSISNDEDYVNYKDKRLTQRKDLFDKSYLILDSFPERKWKITGGKDIILDRLVLEAVHTVDDSTDIVVYFAPQMPVAAGPSEYVGLPGVVLRVMLDHGRSITTATAIEELAEDNPIEEPSKGKEIGALEYKELRKQRMEEMRELREARRGERKGR